MGSVNRMDQNVAKYWYLNEKMVMVPNIQNGDSCKNCERLKTQKLHLRRMARF